MSLTLVATTGLDDSDQGLASGLFNTSQQIGGALGLAVLSTLAASHSGGGQDKEALVTGFQWAFGGAAVFVLAGLVVMLVALRSRDVARIQAEATNGTGARDVTPLRADAQRNLTRVLDAATEAFAEHGPDVSVDEIARRAGVGHATVFRRFPTKEALVAAVVENHVADLLALARAALDEDDPGAAFTGFVWQAAELHASRRGLFECEGRCEREPRPRRARRGGRAAGRTGPGGGGAA